mgnify:CR=1 FL=1
MNRTRRGRIYLTLVSTIFFINLFNVDFDNLSWEVNKTYYINLIVAIIVWIAIFVLIKKNQTNS